MTSEARAWIGRDTASRFWRMLQSRSVLGTGYGVAALLTGVAILLAASPPATGPLGPTSQLILTVLGFNLALILALTTVVAQRFIALWTVREHAPGARLKMRFVSLFALAAVAPAVVVALFYGVLVNRGVENWFSQRVQTVVENSASVSRSYVDEQSRFIQNHVTLMSGDLNRVARGLTESPATFDQFLASLASYHAFPAAYVIDRNSHVLAHAEAADAPPFVLPPPSAIRVADQGDIWLCNRNCGDVMRSVYRLAGYSDAYLYVVRPVEKGMVAHLLETESSLVAYREAAQDRTRIQAIFALSYVETALLVLVGAVWLGMAAANALSAPIARLVQAAGRVASGDLSARVDAESDPEEIAVLSRAFNSMTHDLQAQQEALRAAQEDADRRREFIETVLAEVSAGVISLDAKGRISAANRQARLLLALEGDQFGGRSLAIVAPEIAAVAAEARRGGDVETEVDVARGRETRRLRVRASRIEDGLVLTFDDITRLMNAQRNAAWRDVARRIAHEIKNPLTPIQLSAERLRTAQAIAAYNEVGGNIVVVEPVPDIALLADERMLSQGLTNVLKNAAEAVGARRGPASRGKGRIRARLVEDASGVAFEVEDNGVGLPSKDRDRLTEPYVTTREKGTGLGLAIVKRILEDHGGELELTDARSGPGALAILRLPASVRTAPHGKTQSVTA